VQLRVSVSNGKGKRSFNCFRFLSQAGGECVLHSGPGEIRLTLLSVLSYQLD
jgi:hypothetical protein